MPKGGGGVLVSGQIALFKIAMKLYLECLMILDVCVCEGGKGAECFV